ncbi:MAG: hypothetical protein SPD80_04090 [Atopobium sp.]|uniref:hypothetical protein n=1 Tax=Atopobium sp. TaxID=1872650 RepID=UPI002A834DEF|nr:hypothetical protein [Atopobium sp.]MDY4522753.1 hypothetical protein [Atopobium sp.]
MNWRVNWTVNVRCDVWHDRMFVTVEEARKFVSVLSSQNEGNPHFMFYVERFVVASTCDFLDHSIPAGAIRIS